MLGIYVKVPSILLVVVISPLLVIGRFGILFRPIFSFLQHVHHHGFLFHHLFHGGDEAFHRILGWVNTH